MQDVGYAELMLVLNMLFTKGCFVKSKMDQLTFLVLFLVMHLQGDIPNVHLSVLATEASLCIWLCGA